MSTELKAYIDGLGEDVSPDVTADFILTKDTSANLLKRVKPSNILGSYQPLDSDLTAIAAISPSNDDVVQRKGGAWTNRTMAQLQTDLNLPANTVTGLAGKVDTTGNQSIAGIKTFSNGIIVSKRIQLGTAQVITAGANPVLDCSLGSHFTLTPGEDETITATNLAAGQMIHLQILTSGASSRTLTFSTGFKPSATLATGTSSGKYFLLVFLCDSTGTYLLEQSRTAAL